MAQHKGEEEELAQAGSKHDVRTGGEAAATVFGGKPPVDKRVDDQVRVREAEARDAAREAALSVTVRHLRGGRCVSVCGDLAL